MTLNVVSDEEVKTQLTQDEFLDVKVNGELLIHIKRSDVGYIVDVYRDNNDPDLMEDSGFIDSITVWDDDLSTDEDDED